MAQTSSLTEHRVLIGLGSNLGDRLGFLRAAINAVETGGVLCSVVCSPVYESAPIGFRDQPDYLNCCIAGTTTLAPEHLHRVLAELERRLGRRIRPRWHEREIDLDIILYDDLVLESQSLTIPHPGAVERAFVLYPARDIVPDWVHPTEGATIAELAERLPSQSLRKTDFCIRP